MAEQRIPLVEVVRMAIDAPRGLECTGYHTLNNRTKHLRMGLYVVVREEGDSQELRPVRPWEHFPLISLAQEGARRRAIGQGPYLGAGTPGKAIIFECHGPDAQEGARIISESGPELGELLRSWWFTRARAMVRALAEFERLVPLRSPQSEAALADPSKLDPLPSARVPPAYRPGRFRCCYGEETLDDR